MKETLRRYPPLPVIPRVATQDFEFGGYVIPRGVDGRGLADPHAPHGGVVARSVPLRPGALHAGACRGRAPHAFLGAVRRRPAPLHRLPLRRGADQRRPAPDCCAATAGACPTGYRMPVQQAPISKPMDGLPVELSPLQ